MSTISTAQATARISAGQSSVGRLATVLKRTWLTYITWRLEQAVIDQLWSMNDRDLKDIGLTRSEIASAVKGDSTRDRIFRRHR